jgi:23S rRNA pseudouridine1911/1915/1917 synthase
MQTKNREIERLPNAVPFPSQNSPTGLKEEAGCPRPGVSPADRHFACRVAPEQGGERLDRFLAAVANISRTRAKSLIEAGHASIDGTAVKGPSVLLRAGQSAALHLPAPADPAPRAETIPLTVVFEDEHLLVIDKPAGLVVHPAGGHETGTLVNALIAHCGASLSGIGGVKRPGIVHRLDKDTSGLLVAAKTDAAHRGLTRLFADHGKTLPLAREYQAFVWGTPARPSGTIDAALARSVSGRQKIAVVPEGRGRHAVTHWRLIESFSGEVSLVACRLETGRTHQIRVHMAHMGHPVLGDPIYAAGFKSKTARLPPAAQACLGLLARQALHAAVLGFPHPVTGIEMRFESPLPGELRSLRNTLALSIPAAQAGGRKQQ